MLPALLFFAFLAGLVDAIAGGGGLIQLPALLLFGPAGLHHTAVLGTNKMSSVFGTTIAALRYSRERTIIWSITIRTALTAAIFSFLGSQTISLVPPERFKPLVLILLILVGAYTFSKKNLGRREMEIAMPGQMRAALIGAVIGFYDGFFGPGTGSLLVFLFVSWAGFSFLGASASAKVVNVATNIGSLAFFCATGSVAYEIALPMAAANMLGGWCGAHVAIKRGSKFVRALFLVMLSLFVVKLALEIWSQ